MATAWMPKLELCRRKRTRTPTVHQLLLLERAGYDQCIKIRDPLLQARETGLTSPSIRIEAVMYSRIA